MALDVNIGYSTIPTATLSAISSISGHSFNVKTGRGSASLVQASFVSANSVYGKISGSDIHAGGIIVPASQQADIKQAWLFPDVPLPEGSVIVVEGYQNSGGNQAVASVLVYRYQGQYKAVTPSEIVGKRMLVAQVSTTVSSGVPSSLGSITTNLKADKEYAIVGIYAVGTTVKALWIDAPELNGMRAGGVCLNTGTGDAGVVDFASLGECPVVSGRSPAVVQAYANGNETVTAYVFMVEL